MSNENTENSMFTKEELETLGKLKDIRLKLVDHLVEDGMPDKVGDVRVLNEVITSADKMIVDTATLRLKQEENANNAAMGELAANILMQARANQQEFKGVGEVPTIPNELTNIDTVDGETDIIADKLDPDDFVAPTYNSNEAGE